MAHSKSAKKSFRQNQVRRMRNKMFRTSVRTKIKDLIINLESDEKGDVYQKYTNTLKALDQAGSKGIFHKNFVARKKSRISRKVMPVLKDFVPEKKEETGKS